MNYFTKMISVIKITSECASLAFLFIALIPLNMYAEGKIRIKGTVTDENKKPLSFANVFIENSPDGTMSEDDGTFDFMTKLSGKATLTASMVGYKTWKKSIELNKKEVSIEIELEEKPVSLNEAVITASSYGSEKEKGLVVSRIDILTTPGGAADIFQALKTMPGMTQVSESAELYVRGGDPMETTTIIDQAVVYHPFTFESSYGGLFSNVNQSVVRSLYFTSGGFSAKYGNCLSGVLDIETRNQPEAKNLSLGVSMANASLTASMPIIDNKLGAYFDYRKSFTKPIFWLNGGLDRFTAAPNSESASGALVYSYSKSGRIKLFATYAEDLEGVNVENPEYAGEFHGDSRNIFLNLQNSELVLDNLLVKNSLSFNRYTNLWKLGVLDLTKTDRVFNFRNDIEFVLNSSGKILSGFEYERRLTGFEGIIPESDYDIRPDAQEKMISAGLEGARWGIYSEFQSAGIFSLKNVSFTGGLRLDNFTDQKLSWLDPRASLGYKINGSSSLRFGWGIFHQIPDPRLFADIDGNPDLKAMRAIHYIASYDYKLDEDNSFRIEVYHKKYDNLPLEKPVINYDNSGYGYANGVDVIFKGTLPFDINGWISYGYINTKRLWMDYEALTSSSYDITHSLTIVAKYNINQNLQLGINAKYATGRPYTPVVGAIYHSGWGVYEPVYAPSNSGRFPDYKRLDMRLTYLGELFSKLRFVAYAEGLNILNLRNIFGYSYSKDYVEKKEIKSYFGSRMLVFGFSVDID